MLAVREQEQQLGEADTAEQEVADLLPIGADPADARRVLSKVPFWFHTFALNRGEGIYTPGVARDHRYRIPPLPGDFEGASVLDVGAFDGFYSFLAEARGAKRVVAVDNEQYRAWVKARWDVDLRGGEGFWAIHKLLDSSVAYRRLDAYELDRLDERFDFIYCFGILHRVMDPGGLLNVLRELLVDRGTVLLETYGASMGGAQNGAVHSYRPGEVYADDDYVHWGFTRHGLADLAEEAGFGSVEILDTPTIDDHPRILAALAP